MRIVGSRGLEKNRSIKSIECCYKWLEVILVRKAIRNIKGTAFYRKNHAIELVETKK